MKGQVGEMAWLYLGFSGWLFACLALLPYFYVSPLFLTTRAVAVHRLQQRSPVPEPAPPFRLPQAQNTPPASRLSGVLHVPAKNAIIKFNVCNGICRSVSYP